MKYIKHEEHGILAVTDFTVFQKKAGWKECDIDEELKKKVARARMAKARAAKRAK